MFVNSLILLKGNIAHVIMYIYFHRKPNISGNNTLENLQSIRFLIELKYFWTDLIYINNYLRKLKYVNALFVVKVKRKTQAF